MRARRILPVLLAFLALLFRPAALRPVAERLTSEVRPIHYTLAFDVNLERGVFEGTATIRVHLDRPTTRIVLNAADLTFHDTSILVRATRQSARVSLDKNAQTATLTVPRSIPAGEADVQIRYGGILNDQLRGFYVSRSGGRNYAITQFESSDARRAFPCFDEPALKATFDLRLTIDSRDTAISNGRLISDTPGPGASRHTVTFATTPKMSSYLVAMAVGDFQCLEDTVADVPIRICATPDKKALGHIALEWAKRTLTFYNSYYSIPYPFGKLDMVAVPDFAAAAMENTAAIFYREADLLADSATASRAVQKNIASIVAHEMAHQWFGNLVTMRWWDDLWLNEGFATWMANRPLAATMPEWSVDVDEADATRAALNVDALPTTRALRSKVETPDQVEASFDAIAYEKGAAVLRMIERYVGPDLFRKSINAYLETYAYGSATSEDFWTIVASTSDMPVDRILPTFVNQPGAPLVELSLDCRNGRTELSLRQTRLPAPTDDLAGPRSGGSASAAASPVTPGAAWQIPLCVRTPGQSAPACQVFAAASARMTVGAGCQPWAFVNAGANGYYRTAYAPGVLRALAPSVGTLTATERASLADDEWTLVRAGRHTVADYLTLADGFGGERSPAVLAQVLGRLEFIHHNVVTDTTRPAFARWVRRLLGPLYTDVGVDAPIGDTENRRALRAVVVGALGTIGDDPVVGAAARTALDAVLSNAPAASDERDTATASAVVSVAARRGDRQLFDALVTARAQASAPDQQRRYLFALAAFEDPPLSQRALEFALSPDVGRQDTAVYLARFLGNPAVNLRAWQFLKAHWSEIQPKVGGAAGEARIVEALGAFCTAAERDDIRAFFTPRRAGAATRTLDQTLERITACMTFREAHASILAEWLRER